MNFKNKASRQDYLLKQEIETGVSEVPTATQRGGVLLQQLPTPPDPLTTEWVLNTLYPVLIASGAFSAPA